MTSRIKRRRARQLRRRFLLVSLIVTLMLGIATVDRYFNARQTEALHVATIQKATQRLDTPINGTAKVTKAELQYLNTSYAAVQQTGPVKLTVVADVTTRPYQGVRYRLLRTRVINTSRHSVDARRAYGRFSGESYRRQVALADHVQRLAVINPAFANEYQPVTKNIDNWAQLSQLPAHGETDVVTVKVK